MAKWGDTSTWGGGAKWGDPPLDATLLPSGIASEEAFGSPAIAVGTVTVLPVSIVSEETFGTALITLAITNAGGIASAESIPSPTITSTVELVAFSIVSAEAFGSPAIAVGAVTVSPVSIASEEAFGSPAIILAITDAGAIISAEAFGTPALSVGTVSIFSASITSQEAFGQAVIFDLEGLGIIHLNIPFAPFDIETDYVSLLIDEAYVDFTITATAQNVGMIADMSPLEIEFDATSVVYAVRMLRWLSVEAQVNKTIATVQEELRHETL